MLKIHLKYLIVYARIHLKYWCKLSWIYAKMRYKMGCINIAGFLIKLAFKISPTVKKEMGF
jgi:hypothetical protein